MAPMNTAQPGAWRWVMFTDMALTSYNGADGIDVIVRSLETARPMAGVDVSLLARNNDVLAKVKSDGDGFVRFPGPVTKGQGRFSPANDYGLWRPR